MSRRKRHEEHENHERWLVSYADFITLLFAFFVVLYATSNNDPDKQKKFEDSVRAEMKLASISPGNGNTPGGELIPELINPMDNFPRRGSPAEVQDYVERQLRKQMTKEEIAQAGIEVHQDALGARITLAASSFFQSGDTKIKKSALAILDKVAGVLKTTDRKIIIEGHTDDQPIQTEAIASNWELASLRASSVVRYLIKYQGLEGTRLAAMSYADQKPVGPNNTDENRAKNRRIEILITSEVIEK